MVESGVPNSVPAPEGNALKEPEYMSVLMC